jgi:hypothetical protein
MEVGHQWCKRGFMMRMVLANIAESATLGEFASIEILLTVQLYFMFHFKIIRNQRIFKVSRNAVDVCDVLI